MVGLDGSRLSVGLTVVGLGGSRLTAAPVSSRRTAASANHKVGGSTGAVGEFPASGFNTLLIRFAIRFDIRTRLGAGVADCAVMTAVGDDDVDTGVVVLGAVTPGVDSRLGVTDGVFTTTGSVATAPFVSVFSGTAVEDDAVEFAAELADVDDHP